MKDKMRPEDNPQLWHQQKTYESMITYGVNVIKFVLLANGGAIVAILTFIGNHTEKALELKPAIFAFIIGTVLGGIVNILAYITQLTLFNQTLDKVKWFYDHQTWLWATIASIFLGVVCFAIGSVLATCAF